MKLFIQITRLIERNKVLDKQVLWRKVVGAKKPYDDVRFRKYASDLYKVIRNFLVVETLQNDPSEQRLMFIQSLIGRSHLDKVKSSVKKEVEDYSLQVKKRGAVFHRNQHFVERKLYELFNLDTQRDIKPNLEEISNHVDVFYLIEKLRIMCEISTRKTSKKHTYDIFFTQDLVATLEKNSQFREEYKEVDVYYKMYKLLSNRDGNDEVYFSFKNALKSHAHLFPQSIQIEELYNAAQNYCVRRLNSGSREFLYELFELFERLVDEKTVVLNGRITPWYFRNIVAVGLRLNKFDWVEQFIYDFEPYLSSQLRENAVSFNLAQLYFYQKKYNKVLEMLLHVEYDDLSYNLNSKTILIATYYELDEVELLSSHLDTFYTFLNRRKDFPEQRRKPYKELIRYTRKLIRVLPRDKEVTQKLKAEIEANSRSIANASWLLEKLVELEG